MSSGRRKEAMKISSTKNGLTMGDTFYPKVYTDRGWKYDFCNGTKIESQQKIAPKIQATETSNDNWLTF